MRILVAPDSFKESLSAVQASAAIAAGLRRGIPDARLDLVPMADGGEGTVEALVTATGGRFCDAEVHGPLMAPVRARYGMLGDGRTAVIEMAAASGLPLIPPDQRDPTKTTTYGTGELLRAALDAGASRIIVGIGGSATTDGGCGCAQALGIKFRRRSGKVQPRGIAGGDLNRIAILDTTGRRPGLSRCEIIVACDVDNPLTGPNGAAYTFGPQKGADPDQCARLDANLKHLAWLICEQFGLDIENLPGAGAAGGLGAGLVAFCGAKLQPGIDIVIEAVHLAERVKDADLVITGEGAIDQTSLRGKTTVGVARVARAAGVPVIALCGAIGAGAEQTLESLDAYFCLVDRPMTFEQAKSEAAKLLTRLAEQVGRVVGKWKR